MPANQSLGVRDNCKIETAIREIDVAVGTVILTRLPTTENEERKEVPRPETITLGPGDTKAFDPPESGFDVYAPEGARFHLTYETDPVDTEEARRKPGTARSSQARRKSESKPKPSRRSSATKVAGKGSASGKASASGSPRKGGSRASKSASSKSGGRKRSSTKSTKKRS